MAINLTDSIRVGQQKPLDDKYFNGLSPYATVSEANTSILSSVRHRGLTVNIAGKEYWYKTGIGDGDLVEKTFITDWTKVADDIYNNNSGKVLLFGTSATNTNAGLNIFGRNSTKYGCNNSENPAIINFIPNPTPDNYPVEGSVSGIQSQDYNAGNVRAGIYFISNSEGRPDIVFATNQPNGLSPYERLRIQQDGIILGTTLFKYKTDLSGTFDARTLIDKGYADATYLSTGSAYTLPVATSSVLGGVKKGDGVSIASDGTISVSTNYQAPLSGSGIVKSTSGTISYISGTSSQFVKADGSLDSNTYLTTAVTSVTATSPITSSGGTTPVISTSMATNKLIGRSTAGTGVMEQITIGSGLTLSGGILTNTATPTPTGYYGAFEDRTIQTAAAINTPYAIKFGMTDLNNGVTVVSDGSNLTRITIANTGVYNIQFSAQFDRTNSGTDSIDIWLRENGVDVPGSGGKIVMTGGATASQTIASWNYVLNVVGGYYYQLMWSTPDTHVRLLYEAAQTSPFAHPIIPSVILTVTQQSGIMAGTGLTAINSLTGATQTLTTGTTGNDFAIVDSGTDHKFNLPDASATARGVITTGSQTIAGAKTFSTAPILNSLTASQILALDASKNIQSLDTATYPSLSELTWLKGATSSIQTQLNGKQATLSLTSGYIPKATGTSTLGDSLIQDNGTTLGVGGISTTSKVTLIDTTLAGTGLQGSLLDLQQTWNNASGNPITLKINVTNTASLYNAVPFQFQVSGTPKFSISKDGFIAFGLPVYSPTIGLSGGITSGTSTSGKAIGLFHNLTTEQGYGIFASSVTGSRTATSNECGVFKTIETFNPTTGLATYNGITLANIINQTAGVATGITRGLYINPTLTSAQDFRGIEIVSGSVVLPYLAITSSYSIKTSDYLIHVTTGVVTATLPTAVGCAGKNYIIKNTGASLVTVATTSSQTIDGLTTVALGATLNKYINVVSTGANWIIIANN